MTSSASRQISVKTRPPRLCRMAPPSAGIRAAIEVKISTDMPLPIPFSVSSSPSHMMTAVPAVRVTTRTTVVHTESDGMMSCEQFGNSWPLRARAMIPVLCRMASAIVRYRVYWVSFCWPDCPSFFSCSKRGMTTTSSCTMMLAVMYGMMPSAKIDSRSSAPPENRFTSEYRSRWSEAWACSRQLLMASTETPGPGIAAPRRYTAMIARENSSLRRRSGVRNAAANACSTCPPLIGRMRLAIRGPVAAEATGPREAPCSVPSRACEGRGQGVLVSDAGGAAPGRADLLSGGRGEGVRVHVHLDTAQVAGAEDLHRLATAHGTGLGEGVGVHRAALGEQGRDPVEVDDLE